MRRQGIWHPLLAAEIAAMGHGDEIIIADPGLPIPRGAETVIDLVYAANSPRLSGVLSAVASELVVEVAVVANELADGEVLTSVRDLLSGIPLQRRPHADLKKLAHTARVIVRTGETTPYANVVLRAGVPF
ncbi:D-ribose pyranase [Agromyces bracchium]|uniref:D-ribose pyranase n=1 Tax=Agromyces bracchium TaxID=88376 RepID=A0A6I3MB68_9MICO|nr:D-ribose pyranase [Agromyces bracchium]MTH69382.1 D-ribose pyranase [Agromyces bracchium]